MKKIYANDFDEAIDIKMLSMMLLAGAKPEFVLKNISSGYELFIKHDGKVFKLFTQRNNERVFRNITSAISVLKKLSVTKVTIIELNN